MFLPTNSIEFLLCMDFYFFIITYYILGVELVYET
jgi:hypothetical protein